MNRKKHWELVYEKKDPSQVSWTQAKPEISLQLIQKANLSKTAKIIDIGGGDSNLVDYLLEAGYKNITVLDISTTSIEKAKKRLGHKATMVTWIVTDITGFRPTEKYDLWHDRATFHFLTSMAEIDAYKTIARKAIKDRLIIGTFSKNGPLTCSGLEIAQYDEEDLTKVFEQNFKKIECSKVAHITPFNTVQNFQFCSFKVLL